MRFKQRNAEAACGCIHGNAHAGCAAADDDDIPWLAPLAKSTDHLVPVHLAAPVFRAFDGALPLAAALLSIGRVHLRLEADVGLALRAQLFWSGPEACPQS